MKWAIIYILAVSLILTWNYCAAKLNEKYDNETPNKD